MKLTYYVGKDPNFGDDLNPWMWPQLLPNFFDNDEQAAFIGTGSIIGMHQFQHGTKKIVMGSGFVPQYYDNFDRRKFDVHGADWDIRFVRGLHTAKRLNLAPELAIGDSAILLHSMINLKKKTPDAISFMPHWGSLGRGNWEKVCHLAGINLIDPRRSVDEVLGELMRSKLVIAEAMHGAIVADALRIPWIPLMPIAAVHREKWFDWASALDLKLNRHRLWPSSLSEVKLSILRRPISASPFKLPLENGLTHLAAHRLTQLSKVASCMSADSAISRATERMLDTVEKVRDTYGK